ncbi:MAG: alkaline phosphatase family protein [Candidatus Jordarchaeales archaeon]
MASRILSGEVDCCAAIVVLDGCSIRALKRAHTPVIDEIARLGVATFKCRSVAPTATYTGHASIVTGTAPSVHGIVGNFYYDREQRKVVWFDVDDVNAHLDAATLFEAVEAGGCVGEPVTRGARFVVPKEEVQARDVWEQDAYAITMAVKIVEEERPVLLVVNLPGVDGVGERYGASSREASRILEEDDKLIGKLQDALRECYDDYLLVVTADHGMTDVKENVNLEEELDGLDPVVCTSHRFAHIYLKDVMEAKRRLEKDGRLSLVLTHSEAERLSLHNPRSGDLMVAARPGYELSKQSLRGSHGGLTRDEMLVPLVVNKPEYADLVRDWASITDVALIVRRYLVERRCVKEAMRLLSGVDPAHGWRHVERVLACSTRLALKYGADVETVRLASVLHDVGKGVTGPDHVEGSINVAASLLREVLPGGKLEKVLRAISSHHTYRPEELKGLEEAILWDCDKLDALGVVGFARCLEEEGWKGGSINDAVEHLKRDTEMFSQRMHFKETRRLAKLKVRWGKRVVKILAREIDGLSGKYS